MEFKNKVNSMVRFFSLLLGKINIICDGWSEYSTYHFLINNILKLEITSTFIHDNNIKTLTLSFIQTEKQSGEDLKVFLVICITRYKKVNKINAVITENCFFILILSICKRNKGS